MKSVKAQTQFLIFILAISFCLSANVWGYQTPGSEEILTMDDLVSLSAGAVAGSSGNYTVTESVTISPSDTLQIRAGDTIQFAPDTHITVNNTATLTVSGTSEQKATFTSAAATPAAGKWWGIYFARGSIGTLRHAVIEYAQYGVYVDGNGAQTLTECTIRYNTRGIQARFDGTIPQLVIHQNALHDNTEYNYVLDGNTWNTTTLDARDNWWGTDDPEAIADTIWDFFDDGNRGVIDYTGFLDSDSGSAVPGNYLIGATDEDTTLTVGNYIVPSSYWVRLGHTLIIPSGTTLSFGSGKILKVSGVLTAIGIESEKITFTSAAATPAAGKWWGIYFARGSIGTLRHAVIEYAQYGVYVDGNGAQTLTECTIRYNTRGIQARFDGTIPQLVIHQNALHDNTEYNYVLDGNTWNTTTLDARDNWWGTDDPEAIADTIWDFFDDGNRGVIDYTGFLDSDSGSAVPGNYLIGATDEDTTLTVGNYIVPSSYWVRPGHTLTIPSGTMLSFGSGKFLKVSGILTAVGIESKKITFTSSATEPAAGDWKYIAFSHGSTGHLSHCEIAYADYGVKVHSSGYATSVTMENCILHHNTNGIYANQRCTVSVTSSVLRDNVYAMRAHAYYHHNKGAYVPNVAINNSALYENSGFNYLLEWGHTYSSDPVAWGATVLDATNNWWGTDDPQEIRSTIHDLENDGNLGHVNFGDFLSAEGGSVATPPEGGAYLGALVPDGTVLDGIYQIPATFRVPYGQTLEIAAGTILRFEPGARLWVMNGGSLTCNGSAEMPIVFTSSVAEPAAGDWKYIAFSHGSTGHLSHCEIAYADYGVKVHSSGYATSVTMENCILHHNTNGIYANQRCTVSVTSSVLRDNVYAMRAHAYYHHNKGAYVPNVAINNSALYENSGFNYLLEWGHTYSSDPVAWGTTVLDATNNWWGTQNESEIIETIWDKSDNGNLGTVNYTPWKYEFEDSDPPVIIDLRYNGESIESDTLIDQPGRLSFHASDIISGIGRVLFYVNGELKDTKTGPNGIFSFEWNILNIPDGFYTIKIEAYDTLDNMVEVVIDNLQVALASPVPPLITFPLDGVRTSRPTVTIAGTADSYSDVYIYRNDLLIISGIAVNNDGRFQVVVPLDESDNLITATAVNRGGESTESPSILVVMDPSALAPPIGLSVASKASGLIHISWQHPYGGIPKGYYVYRSTEAFGDPQEGVLLTTEPLTNFSYDDLPASEGTYHYLITSVDAFGDESDPTPSRFAVSDSTPPVAESIEYTPLGNYDPDTGRMASGKVELMLIVSEPLAATPFLSITPEGGSPIAVELTKDSDLQYSGIFIIDSSTPTGTAYAVFSCLDAVGNRGTQVLDGDNIEIDTRGPSVTYLEVEPGDPIRNDSAAPITLTMTIGLGEAVNPGDSPELSYLLSGPGRDAIPVDSIIPIAALPGYAETWEFMVTLPADAGEMDTETLRFFYSATDDLGNTNDEIQSDNQFQVYQGDLPPLETPTSVNVESLPSGEIHLKWDPVEEAAGYQIYRQGPGDADLIPYQWIDGDVAEFIDQPQSEGNYTYAVASIRSENGQETISGTGTFTSASSDSTAPEPPWDLRLELIPQGIKCTWKTSPSVEPLTYTVYRSDQPDILSVDGLTPIRTAIADLAVIDDQPSHTDHCYVITAVDVAGNESSPSNSFYLNFDLLPVSSLSVQKVENDLPVVSLTHSGGSIAGYDIYLGPEDKRMKLNEDLLVGLSYTDTGYAEDERKYTVIAIDSNGHESLGRSITLPLLDATLKEGEKICRGIMNRLEYVVENHADSRINHVRLKVGINTNVYTSEAFGIDAHSSQVIPVIVGGYTDLPDLASLTAILEIIPNEGERIEIVQTSETLVEDDSLVLGILNEEFLRGGTGKVRFTLENTGEEEIEIVTATGSGSTASNEIRLYLLDPDGNVLSSAPYKQNLGENVVTLANGKTIARIPAGSVFTSEPIEIPVPNTAPDEVTIQLTISKLHHSLGKPEAVTMEGVSTTHQVSLVDTSYYGEVLTITPESSNGDQDIEITGRAVERATGLPMADAPLNIVVSVNGFERTYNIFTGDAGSFHHTFSPLPGESGVYNVRAVHPDLTDKPVQGQFVISRMTIHPATINLSIPRNYEQAINIRVTAGEETIAHNLRLIYDELDQPQGTFLQGVNVNIGSPEATLASKQSASLGCTIWADNTAEETGKIVFKIKSDETGDDSWGTVIVNTHFSNAQPALYYTPDHLETGLALDDSVSETIILGNRGLADLNDVSLALVNQDGTPAPNWAHLNSGSDQGVIKVGDDREISLTFSPTSADVSEGMYSFYLRISSSNYPVTNILLFVSVTQSGVGNIQFKVADIYTGTIDKKTNEIIQGLVGAKIKVQNEEVLTVEQTQTTDSFGEGLFADLPAGRYKCRITAENHQQYIGRFWIKPGITVGQDVILEYDLVTVEWEVTETTIEDKYEIVLTATYKTDVPTAVVVAEPASLTLPPMKAGDVYHGEFTLTNYGLIRAINVNYNQPKDNLYFKYELLTGLPDIIEAKDRITVPYRVTCLQSPNQEEESGSGGGNGSSNGAFTTYYDVESVCGSPGSTSHWLIGCCIELSSGDYISGQGGAINISKSVGVMRGGGTYNPPELKIEGVLCREPRTCPVDDICCILETAQSVGSSVDLIRGEYRDQIEDLTIKAPGHLTEVKRYFYDDMWHFRDLDQNLEIAYEINGTTPKTINKDGVSYTRSNTEGTVFSFGTYRHIYVKEYGYRWENKWGDWGKFDLKGRLISNGDANGVQVSFIYEAGEDGKPTGVADKSGSQVLWYEYNGQGRISAVHDASERRVEYEYTSDKLTKVIDVLGYETHYAYDGAGRLVSKTDPEGHITTISYNKYGYVVSVTDEKGEGNFFDYAYDAGKKENYASVRHSSGKIKEVWFNRYGKRIRTDINGTTVERITYDGRNKTIKDAKGNKTFREYDEWESLIKEIYADGSWVSYTYEPKYHNLIKKVDERCVVTEYSYDSAGNLVRQVETSGTPDERVTEFTYDADSNRLTEKNLGDASTPEATTTMAYDEFGNRVSVTDTEGNLTTFTYDIMGNVLTKTDAKGKIWTYAYNAKGWLTSSTDPLENVTTYVYDGLGNIVKEIDAEGREKTFAYDENGNLIRSVDTGGNVTLYEYDSDGNLVKKTDSEGKSVSYTYDAFGRLAKTIDGNGNQTQFEYDLSSGCSSCSTGGSEWQASRIIFPTFVKEYTYDLRGRKIQEKEILSETESYVSEFAYDEVGNLISSTDKESKTTTHSYDNLNRLISTTDPLGNTTEYTYDDRNNLLTLKDADENITQFEYDRNNRTIRETRPLGQVKVSQYDAVGNVAAILDAKGQRIEYGYNDAGRQIEIQYFSTEDYSIPVKTVTFSYDKIGNLISYNDSVTSAHYVYDDAYRKLSETVDYGGFQLGYSYSYYKNGTKKTFTGPDGITYSYTYDNNNQLKTVNIPNKGYITYDSYIWKRPERISYPGGTTREYAYDPLMRLKQIQAKGPDQNPIQIYVYEYDAMNNIISKRTEHGDYTYGYDDLYRLTKANAPHRSSETFTYDSVGNRLTSADVSGSWSYNANNELLSYNETSFDYDANGNTIRKTVGNDPAGAEITNYIYNIQGRLIRVENGNGFVIASYYYDPFERRLWKEVSGIRTCFAYADEGLIAEVDAAGSVGKMYGYQPGAQWGTNPLFMKDGEEYCFYHNDHLGTPMFMTNATGVTIWSAYYDSFGDVTIDSSSIMTSNLRFPGQYSDNESGYCYNFYRYYNPITGRYLILDPIGYRGGINLFAYVKMNPINKIDPFGLWFNFNDPPGPCFRTNDGRTCCEMNGYMECGSSREERAREYYRNCMVECLGKSFLDIGLDQLRDLARDKANKKLNKTAGELAKKYAKLGKKISLLVTVASALYDTVECRIECSCPTDCY